MDSRHCTAVDASSRTISPARPSLDSMARGCPLQQQIPAWHPGGFCHSRDKLFCYQDNGKAHQPVADTFMQLPVFHLFRVIPAHDATMHLSRHRLHRLAVCVDKRRLYHRTDYHRCSIDIYPVRTVDSRTPDSDRRIGCDDFHKLFRPVFQR